MCEDCAVADSMFFMLFSSVVNREAVRLEGGTGKVVLTIDFQYVSFRVFYACVDITP